MHILIKPWGIHIKIPWSVNTAIFCIRWIRIASIQLTLHRFPSTVTSLVNLSKPNVDSLFSKNLLMSYLWNMEVLPTPRSPASTILYSLTHFSSAMTFSSLLSFGRWFHHGLNFATYTVGWSREGWNAIHKEKLNFLFHTKNSFSLIWLSPFISSLWALQWNWW